MADPSNSYYRKSMTGDAMRAGDGFATGQSAASSAAPFAETTGPGALPAPSSPGTRSRGRGLRLLAAAVLVALAAALPPATAEAQSKTLVSNLGKPPHTERSGGSSSDPLVVEASATRIAGKRLAQGFTTGGRRGGYTLGSVALNLLAVSEDVMGTPPTVSVSVCAADGSGNPGTDCHALTGPGTLLFYPTDPDSTEKQSSFFTPPLGTTITLESRKTYFVVASVSGGNVAWVSTGRTSEDAGSIHGDAGRESGWSIGNDYRERGNGGWSSKGFSNAPGESRILHVAIRGQEIIDHTAPRVSSIIRHSPTDSRTAADALTWGVIFTEEVENVNPADFTLSGTDATVSVTPFIIGHKLRYDVMASGGDLADLNGRVTLSFARGQNIVDGAGFDLVNTRPARTNDSSYFVDNQAPQLYSATIDGTKLTLTYDEALDTSSVPSNQKFAVDVAGVRTGTSTSVAVSGPKVTLTLLSAVTHGQVVEVSYGFAAADTVVIKDLLGNKADSIRSVSNPHPVTNLTAGNATGKPRIMNSPIVGNNVYAKLNGIGDPQGTAGHRGVSGLLCYSGNACVLQWIRVDGTDETDIPGATGRSYRLTSEDVGKRVKVRVSFNDAANNRETVTSDAYPGGSRRIKESSGFNSRAAGAPGISGSSHVGATLMADRGTIRDGDGLPDAAFPTDYRLQWIRVDADGRSNQVNIRGATSRSYRLTGADAGKRIKLRVAFVDLGRTNETVESGAWPASGTIGALPANLSHCVPTDPYEIWCASLTVANEPSGDGTSAFGFCRVDGCGNQAANLAFGLLSDHDFEAGGTRFLVDSLRGGVRGGAGGGINPKLAVHFETDKVMPDAILRTLTLHVGTKTFPLSDAAQTDSRLRFDGGNDNPAILHTEGDIVPVKLVRTRNRDATGAPTVFGQSQEGATLTASTRGISDANGLRNVSYRYQWIRVDSDGMSNAEDIAGATSRTYILSAAEVGKKVRMKVSFTDDKGFEEELTSPAWPSSGTVVAAPSASVLVSNISETGGAGTISVATHDRAQGFTASGRFSSYTLTGIELKLRGTLVAGTCTVPGVRLVTGTPTASGGVTLTHDPADVTGCNADIDLAYTAPLETILRRGNTYYVVAEGEGTLKTTSSSSETSNFIGWSIDNGHLRRSAGSTGGFARRATEVMNIRVNGRANPPNRPADGAPVISGLARQGATLSASTSEISDRDGLTLDRFRYQWVRVDADGSSNPEDIAGATSSRYTLAAADVGKRVTVKVRFRDDDGHPEEVISAAWPSSGTVTVHGAHAHCTPSDPNEIWCARMTVGEYRPLFLNSTGRITESGQNFGSLDPDSFLVNGSPVRVTDFQHYPTSLNFRIKFSRNISLGQTAVEVGTGAGKTRLLLDIRDDRSGHIISGANVGGSWSVDDQIPVRLVRIPGTPATGAPTIAGDGRVGQMLTASTSGISDANGLTSPGWEYQWIRFDAFDERGLVAARICTDYRLGSRDLGTMFQDGTETDIDKVCAGIGPIAGATLREYTLTEADLGKALMVRVSFRDDAGHQENRTSAPWGVNRGVRPAHCSASDPDEIWCAQMSSTAPRSMARRWCSPSARRSTRARRRRQRPSR